MVEEDEEVQLATAPDFDFGSVAKPRSLHHETCPRDPGGYWICTFSNDLYWNLDRLDNLGPLYGYKAYAYNSGGSTVRAYVVDTGVYAAHNEFGGRVETGANMMVDPDISDPVTRPDEEPPITADGTPADNPCGAWQTNVNAGAGHGTGVASVLGGRTTGVAKHVTIVPVKVFTCGLQSSKLAVARGLDWIGADMRGRPGRAVVNMSLAFDSGLRPAHETEVCEDGKGGYTPCMSALEHAINTLIASNIVVVVSANNQNENRCNVQSPARLGYGNESNYASTSRTITVGGTMYTGTYTDERWTCARQPGGCTAEEARNNPGSNFGACVSIWAPAWNVQVAGAAGPDSYRTGFRNRSGTSFAAPLVAGAAARLLERFPGLTPRQVWDELFARANQRAGTPDFDPSAIVNRRLVYMPATE